VLCTCQLGMVQAVHAAAHVPPPGKANDVLSANFASWSENICVQEHIATGSSRETGLGNHHTSYQGAFPFTVHAVFS
jgi:hypothetical protein